jgi:hypothetical protein
VAPFDPKDSFPTFEITNDGYLKVTDVEATCFFKVLETSSGNKTVNGFLGPPFTSPGYPQYLLPQKVLNPNQTVTLPCSISLKDGSQITQMDIGIVVHFRFWPFAFWRTRKIQRFAVGRGDNGLVWHELPPNELEAAYEAALKRL